MTIDFANGPPQTDVRVSRASCSARVFRAALGIMTILPLTFSEASAQSREREEVLGRVLGDINLTPDHACTLPQTYIEERLAEKVNAVGLMDNIALTVFGESPANETAYEAQMRKIREDTERQSAQNRAIYQARQTGGQTPVGRPFVSTTPKYRVEMETMKAVGRIENGLDCSATVRAKFLRFTLAYNIVLDVNDADGWTTAWRPPLFTEDAALSGTPSVFVRYRDDDLTLAQARKQAAVDVAHDRALADATRRKADADAAFRNSPAGRVAALRQRQALAVKQRACEANGGTWGYPVGRTIMQVDALTSSDLEAMNEACYFLGK